MTVLIVGATGRTGGRVLEQLLGCGTDVRAIVRSASRLPQSLAENPGLTVVEADLLSLSDQELERQVRGCDAVISCLGHPMNAKGMFGPPRDLVTQATRRLCRAIEATRPEQPIKFILMSSVSVNQPAGRDTHRGRFEKSFIAGLAVVIPPAADNQRAADFLCGTIGTANPFVQWVAVRPDSLLEGEVTEYVVHDALVSTIFKPDATNMANVAHFMCGLVRDPSVWAKWANKLPVIVNAVAHPAQALVSRGAAPATTTAA